MAVSVVASKLVHIRTFPPVLEMLAASCFVSLEHKFKVRVVFVPGTKAVPPTRVTASLWALHLLSSNSCRNILAECVHGSLFVAGLAQDLSPCMEG